jgi:hypothetical protein
MQQLANASSEMEGMESGQGEQMGEEMMKEMMKEFEKMGEKEDFQNVIDGMMRQLLSKEVMYTPMKQVQYSIHYRVYPHETGTVQHALSEREEGEGEGERGGGRESGVGGERRREGEKRGEGGGGGEEDYTHTLPAGAVHCALYSYTMHYTRTLCIILVHCALYSYTMHYTRTLCIILVHCALYSYTMHYTRTLCRSAKSIPSGWQRMKHS